MKRTELLENSPEVMLLKILTGWQKGLWTALPGVINSFDATTMTCTVKPAILEPVQLGDSPTQMLDLPLLQDVPVFFPSAGGYTMTFPVAKGDECLVVFSSRCIDGWFGYGMADPTKIPNPPYERMHDLSDGFALIGFRSAPRALLNISSASIQLRDDAGNNLLEIRNGGIININSTAQVNVNTVNANVNASNAVGITAPAINVTGNLTVAGTLTMTGGGAANLGSSNLTTSGDVTAGGKSLKTHVHSGVTPGTGNTGAPV